MPEMEERDDTRHPPPPSMPASMPASLTERLLASLPTLTRFVRRRMGPELAARESASDIVQSTCRELLRSASSFEDRGDASFQRWVRAAAEHKLQNRARHWRTLRRAGEPRALDLREAHDTSDARASAEGVLTPAAPLSAHPSQEAMLREEAQRLERAFRALTPEYRAVLQRSQIDGASHAEIARETGRTSEAVRKLVARALARLSAELERDDEEPDDDQRGSIERAGRTPVP